MIKPWIRNLISSMPKAELHLHLDGSLRIKTAIDLMIQDGQISPDTAYSWKQMYNNLVVDTPVGSQKELLAYFTTPINLMQSAEALRRVTYELLEDKAADNVRYCEIRWAPLLHTRGGLSIPEVIEAVLLGMTEGIKKTGIKAVLIVVGLRSEPLENNLAMLEQAVMYQSRGILGVDFAGVEQFAPDPLIQLKFFRRARELGFKITFHGGEIPGSAPTLLKAVQEIKPDRIAHGMIAIDDLKLCDLLKDNCITLDLCPTSNIQAGLYPSYLELPLERLFRVGVPISINTDDPVLSAVSLSDEYSIILSSTSITLHELWNININALYASFTPETIKKELYAEFNEWALNISELMLN